MIGTYGGVKAAVAMTAAAVLVAAATSAETPKATPTPAAAAPAAAKPIDLSHLVWVRILPFGLRDKGWQLKDRDGQDIIDMIADLKPDVLERFITGMPNPKDKVSMGVGMPTVSFVEYLNAAMKAGAPGAFLTPKVHLNDIWTDDYRYGAAKALHDLPTTPRLNVLSLDIFFSSGTPDEQKKKLAKFKEMGWQHLGYNYAGGPKPAFGMVSYAMAGINKTTWEVNRKTLADMDKEGIKVRLAHIDYPGGIEEFAKLTPDRQADIVQKISREQHQYGFSFVYPVLYGTQGYDSSRMTTKPDGPYKGATVFQVIKKNIECDRQYPRKCTPTY